MFLNFIKKFLIKRKLKNSLSVSGNDFSGHKIKTIGIVVDETYFSEKETLVNKIIAQGIQAEDVKLLLYHDKNKKRDTNFPSFSFKNVNWSGEINNKEAKDFKKLNFDLLISYYDVEKVPLLLVTQKSKAKFKVGFSNIDKRINHLMIDTTAENTTLFVDELFKYLKILNKI